MFRFIKSLLFRLDPEKAHNLALRGIQLAYQLRLTSLMVKTISAPRTVMGLHFPNPVGLAAGFDVNAEYVPALFALGFGFIEVGGVTPLPEVGNQSPWLFRLTEQEAIINRKGFRNKGVDYVAKQLAHLKSPGIIGVNIAKNRATPMEDAIADYLHCFRALWPYASYISVNVSSPNSVGLRDMQKSDFLRPLLFALKQEQKHIADTNHQYVPLVVKISPDLTEPELNELAHVLLEQAVDGVMATNTTTGRGGVAASPYANEAGGLSGRPLNARSTEVIKQLHAILGEKIPIIALGGIMDEASANEKIAAGARLVQIYTGLIYAGPGLISRIATTI